jgi:hypothetical protein
MIVYKYKDKTGRFVEINFCEEGLYIQIDEEDSTEWSFQNIIIDTEGIEELKKYLNG